MEEKPSVISFQSSVEVEGEIGNRNLAMGSYRVFALGLCRSRRSLRSH